MADLVGAVVAAATFGVTVWAAGGRSDAVLRQVVGVGATRIGPAVRRTLGYQIRWFAVLLVGYSGGICVAHVAGHAWASAPLVLPVTVWWGSRALAFTWSDGAPVSIGVVRATGASAAVARAVLAASFLFVLIGVSTATPAVLAATQLL